MQTHVDTITYWYDHQGYFTMTLPRVNVVIDAKHIANVTLQRAEKHNALDLAMFLAIESTIKSLKKNRDLRAIIVSGQGEDFCTGLDVKSVMQNKSNAIRLLFKWYPGQANLAQRVSSLWRTIPVPVIFAIHGRCWGGGLQIALGGDFRIVAPQTSLSIMEAKWGLIPDMGGTLALTDIMAKDQVMKLAMTADEIDAQQALTLGLVTEVSNNPIDAARALAERIINHSPDAIAANKKLYHQAWHSKPWQNICRESYYQVRVLMGKNQPIAVKRVQAKNTNKPEYKPRSF